MLNSIKTLKRYCKDTLNVFVKKKKIDDGKKFHLHYKFFVSSWNFTALHVKTV